MSRIEEFTRLAEIRATAAQLEAIAALSHGRQVQDFEAALVEQIANQVVLMHTLHDHNYAPLLLLVRTRNEGGAIPFENACSNGLGHGIAELDRVINDHEVAADAQMDFRFRGGIVMIRRVTSPEAPPQPSPA